MLEAAASREACHGAELGRVLDEEEKSGCKKFTLTDNTHFAFWESFDEFARDWEAGECVGWKVEGGGKGETQERGEDWI